MDEENPYRAPEADVRVDGGWRQAKRYSYRFSYLLLLALAFIPLLFLILWLAGIVLLLFTGLFRFR